MPELKQLTSPDTLIVLTFAKAGLGHLRVASALLEALPSEAKSVLFSSLDTTTTFMHRLSSVNPIMRALAEAFQYGIAEHAFTHLYTLTLRRRAYLLLPQLEAIAMQQKIRPKNIVFVCTHFGLAHQIGELKTELGAKTGASVKLVVVVTDDSPQRAWNVPESDLTVVPSKLTGVRLKAPNTKVAHYPLSMKLGAHFVQRYVRARQDQADPTSNSEIKVSLPVSGAAVGLNFYRELAFRLNKAEPRFRFYVTSRESAYTKPFLVQMRRHLYFQVFGYEYDRLVVSNYVKLFQRNVVALEITKPSEQAFKALYSPKQRGGAVLLFTTPIGRQEYDNLWYLVRNNLIPDNPDQEELWKLSLDGKPMSHALRQKAKSWRGLRLMRGTKESALFVGWCLREGLFSRMMKFSKKPKDNGTRMVWELVDSLT